MLLADKHALVTGGASGIGRATCELFAREGASVTVVDVDRDAGQAVAAGIGSEAQFVAADVAQADDVRAAVDAAVKAFGPLDVVVSNAAAYALGSAVEISEDDWDRTLDVCLKAAWVLAASAVPVMRTPGGSIVVVSSVHAVRGYRGHAAYQAAKAGLLGLTRSLAADFAPGVRVNAVLPGAVVTGLWRDIGEEQRAAIARQCPLQRNAEPIDLANVVLFLASDMAAYITGTSVVVDGGLTAVVPDPA